MLKAVSEGASSAFYKYLFAHSSEKRVAVPSEQTLKIVKPEIQHFENLCDIFAVFHFADAGLSSPPAAGKKLNGVCVFRRLPAAYQQEALLLISCWQTRLLEKSVTGQCKATL